MRRRLTILAVACCVALVGAYGWYGAYAAADKACLRARVGEPAERARTHLREVATAGGGAVLESGDRISATFRWMFSDVAACTFVARDGKILEVAVGKRALEAIR